MIALFVAVGVAVVAFLVWRGFKKKNAAPDVTANRGGGRAEE